MTDGVWVTYWHDMGVHVEAIYDDELEALRGMEKSSGLLRVAFVPFGVEVKDAIKAKERPAVTALSDTTPKGLE